MFEDVQECLRRISYYDLKIIVTPDVFLKTFIWF